MDKKTNILLSTLSKNELKAFDNFIIFSLRGKSKNVMDYWKARYSSVTNELIPINESSYSRKTLSDFNKQLEKFFVLKNLESDDLGRIVYLTRELRKRNIEKYFDQLINEIKKVRREKLGFGFQNMLKLAELNF